MDVWRNIKEIIKWSKARVIMSDKDFFVNGIKIVKATAVVNKMRK